jgi:hypothetical protein
VPRVAVVLLRSLSEHMAGARRVAQGIFSTGATLDFGKSILDHYDVVMGYQDTPSPVRQRTGNQCYAGGRNDANKPPCMLP